MRTVAKHAFVRVFALAKIAELRFFCRENDWLEVGPGVLAVAKRLRFREATRAPCVLFAFFNFDFSWIFGGDTLFAGDPLLAMLTGGALLGAFYMATDYVTSPTGKTAQLVYGAGIGALTVLIRLKGGYPEGICYAILLMNPLSTILDGLFKPKRFALPVGGEK